MSINRFPLQAIQRVRVYIKNALAIPEALSSIPSSSSWEEIEELPEPGSVDDLSDLFSFGGVEDLQAAAASLCDQWFVSTVNPGSALLKLPGLELKSHLRLVSYFYRSEKNGAGVVWAVPEELSTTAQLEKALPQKHNIEQPPKPVGALPHFMEAIGGNRTPASFILASMLRRELQEFGTMGDRAQWVHHHLIDAIPTQVQWRWLDGQPKDLAPKVKVLPDGQAAVEFFTCSPSPKVSIYRHIDQYSSKTDYRAHSLDKAIAYRSA